MGVACCVSMTTETYNWPSCTEMFEESPFRLSSVASQPAPSKESPKRPKSPPKSCDEWLASKERKAFVHLASESAASSAAGSWPEREPKGEQLLDGPAPSDGGGLVFGTLENIKADIQRHAREKPYNEM